jgi:hypothetical protein
MFENLSEKLASLKIKNPKQYIDRKIRDKATQNAKVKLMENGLTPDEVGIDNFEVIVQEEETKIKSELKDKSIAGMLLALGIDFVMGM